MHALRIEILSNHLDRDRLNPGEPDVVRAEVVYWKRVVAKGRVTMGPAKARLEAVLEVRARLLRIRLADVEDVGPIRIELAAVANGIVNQMVGLTLGRRSELAVPLGPECGEWIVTDAEHVSGLLHRLMEAKTFNALAAAPKPPSYQAVLDSLVAAINENIQASFAFQNSRNRPSRQGYVMPFNTFAWETLRDRFLALEEDIGLQQRFARFFDHVAQYAAAVQAIRENPVGTPDYGKPSNHGARRAAETFIGQNENEIVQMGLKLMDAVGQPFKELPQQLKAH